MRLDSLTVLAELEEVVFLQQQVAVLAHRYTRRAPRRSVGIRSYLSIP